ncbi:MAG TPA: tetratricopeptide repeat protein [Gemmatimonadaceae bacterium]|jgi:TolA-binding protein
MRVFSSSSVALLAALTAPTVALAQVPAPASVSAQPVAATPAPATAAAQATVDSARRAAIDKLTAFVARYPNSTLRPNALYQLAELLVRSADEDYAAGQRAGGGANAPVQPDYTAAVARYVELVTKYPAFTNIDAAAYTLGTLNASDGKYAAAAKMFELVTTKQDSPYRPEAYFRLGDARFDLASSMRGAERKAMFVQAADAYNNATKTAPPSGDIYYLALYKLGWAYYNQATQPNQPEYHQAVDVFGRLVAEYDKLTPDRQARLGLRRESIEYMAIAFTQTGGAEAANQYFSTHTDASSFELPVLRRVAASLRDQGDFTRAVAAYQAVEAKAPVDSGALAAQREIIDIYQNRVIEPDRAQQARLQLVDQFAPGTPWAQANSALADTAAQVRELMLRQSAQYALSQAQQKKDSARFAAAADLYGRYLREFGKSDSAQTAQFLSGEALFGQRAYADAGVAYTHAAYDFTADPKLAQQAGQNAVVAFDSAVVRNKADAATQDSLFAAVDRFVAAFPATEAAPKALIEKGKRASEASRWDVMAKTFQTYAEKYPNEAYTPTAQKLIGDAYYKQGKYAEAQGQWEKAQSIAGQSGRGKLADSINLIRNAAAVTYGDSLIKSGNYEAAAEQVYVAYADRNPTSAKAPDALRNAIETYVLADSAARAHNDTATSKADKSRALELAGRLVSQYPKYQYRVQYQALETQLLADLGKREDAAAALDSLITDNPTWPGRADAMVRRAVMLDSLGRAKDAAAAYQQFSAAYPKDKRAADAQYNAALSYVQGSDSSDAAKAYGTFAARFPRDPRAGAAQQARIALFKATGDTVSADAELARVCVRPSAEFKAACAARLGEQEFRAGAALYTQFKPLVLAIPSRLNLTRKGVERLSAPKRRLLSAMTGHFTRSIGTGTPEWLAASSYYVGLAQWEYGNYLRDVQLPADLTGEQLSAAQAGASQQADQYFTEARKTWQTLVDKAAQDTIANAWVDRAKAALAGTVDESPVIGGPAPAPASPSKSPSSGPSGGTE